MPIQLQKPYSPGKRSILKTALFLVLLLVLGGAASIPFFFETQSLWYKLGIDKNFLRLAKIAGLVATVLIFFQILLAIRIPLFEKIFGLDRVYYLHGINGIMIVVSALLHVALVLIPEGFSNLPIGWKFWPEMVGAANLVLLITIVGTAQLRVKLLGYHRWRTFHRPFGYLLLIGIIVHVLFVSDAFEETLPKWALLSFFCFILICTLFMKYRNLQQSRRKWQVKEILPLNDEVVSLKIEPQESFSYAPGQFVFLSFRGAGISSQPHPFTIASSPDDNTLRFIVKKGGKWTSSLENIGKGEAILQGPFGLFCHQAKNKSRQLLFIAAGVGITPLLSMLLSLGNSDPQAQVTLIWSIRHKKDMFLPRELRELQRRLPAMTLHLIYTGEDGSRLNKEQLSRFLKSIESSCQIFICGPGPMIKKTRRALLTLGFARKNMRWERFSF